MTEHMVSATRCLHSRATRLALCFSLLAGLFALGLGTASASAATGHITGTVTDAGGGGIAAIDVGAYQPAPTGGWETVGTTTTNADGSYDLGGLGSGSYRIRFSESAPLRIYVSECYDDKADLDAAADIVVTDGATTANINAVLGTYGHITGKVENAAGVGLADIHVTASQSGGDCWNQATTKADGSYDIGGLVTGNYRVRFEDYSWDYLTEYFNDKVGADFSVGDNVGVTVGQTTADIDATLAAYGHITGTIRNAGGVGLGGTDVTIGVTVYRSDGAGGWAWARNGQTGAGGAYDINGLTTGTYRLYFSDFGGGYLPEYYDDAPDLETADDVSVIVGATTANIDATLAAYGHVSGTVTSAAAAPLADVTVTVYRPDGSGGWAWFRNVQTVADGGYDINGLDTGSYRVGFEDSAGMYVPEFFADKPDIDSADDVSVTVGSTTAAVDATLVERGHITGTVTDSSGAGLAGIMVKAYRPDGIGPGGWYCPYSGSTAADGSYDVGHLDTGGYRVMFVSSSGDYLTECYSDKPDLGSADVVDVTAGETTPDIDATLSPTPALSSSTFAFALDPKSGWHNSFEMVPITASGGTTHYCTIHYSLDGGTTWAAEEANGFTNYIYVDQGSHEFKFFASNPLTTEAVHSPGYVNFDQSRPTTAAPASASARRGRSATLKYKVVDLTPGSGSATVTIVIKNRAGKVRATLKPGVKAVNTSFAAKFKVPRTWKAGTYRFFVYATDLAGNEQSRVGSNRLVVK